MIKTKLFTIFIFLIVTHTIKAQTVTIIGNIKKSNFTEASALNRLKIKKLNFLKKGILINNEYNKITSNCIDENQSNFADYQWELKNFLSSKNSRNSQRIFVILSNPNQIIIDSLINNNEKIVKLNDLINQMASYKRHEIIVLSIPSNIVLSKIHPNKSTIINNHQFHFSITGTTNYKINSLKIKYEQDWIDIDTSLINYGSENLNDFSIDTELEFSAPTSKKTTSISIQITDEIGYSKPITINSVKTEPAYLKSLHTDMGELEPKTLENHITNWIAKAVWPISFETNVEGDFIEIEYYDLNKNKYKRGNSGFLVTTQVLHCENNKKIAIIMPNATPLVWVVEPGEYSTLISNINKHALCGYYWTGYIKLTHTKTGISSEFIKIKLPGFDEYGEMQYDFLECN